MNGSLATQTHTKQRPTREDEATPTIEIRAHEVKRRSVKATQVLTKIIEYNASRMGLSIMNTSKTSYLSIWAGDDGANAANDGTAPTIMISPLGYWEIPWKFCGELWGSWDANLVATDAAGIAEYR